MDLIGTLTQINRASGDLTLLDDSFMVIDVTSYCFLLVG
jgi:hypothetical protein